MCVTVGPAKLSDTEIYSGEAEHNGKYVHVLAYQNKANNFAGIANAMILPFPAGQELSSENVIDTTDFPNFLKDIGLASKRQTRSLGFKGGAMSKNAVKVFESGSYTVVLAGDANAAAIFEAVSNVPDPKRPNLSKEFFDDFQKLYPGQPVALCCWAGSVKAEPLLWWYEPRDASTLFLPTMDAHDGMAPRLDAKVDVDHILSVGSTLVNQSGSKVHYRDTIPNKYRQLLPDYAFGSQLDVRLPNGDFWCDVADLKIAEGGKFKAPLIRRAHKSESGMTETARQHLFGWT